MTRIKQELLDKYGNLTCHCGMQIKYHTKQDLKNCYDVRCGK